MVSYSAIKAAEESLTCFFRTTKALKLLAMTDPDEVADPVLLPENQKSAIVLDMSL